MTANPPSSRRSRWPIALVVVVVIAIAVAVGVANGGFGGSVRARRPSRPRRWRAWSRPTPASSPRAARCRSAGRSWCRRGRAGRRDPGGRGRHRGRGRRPAAARRRGGGARGRSRRPRPPRRRQAATARAEASVGPGGGERRRRPAAAVAQAQAARRAAVAARDRCPSGASTAAGAPGRRPGRPGRRGRRRPRGPSGPPPRRPSRPRRRALAAAQADEERATLAVAAAELARDHLAITSPIAGTVVSIEPAVGDLVQPGVVVVRVADLSEWRFETSDLSETSVARVREGAAATVTVDGLPGRRSPGPWSPWAATGRRSRATSCSAWSWRRRATCPTDLRWNMTVTIEIDGAAPGS